MNAVQERAEHLRRLLVEAEKSPNENREYIEDLRLSLEKAQTTLDKMTLYGLR